MNYKVVKKFRGSPDGCRVIDFKEGDIVTENKDFPPELKEVALVEGWVKAVRVVKKKAK